MASLDLISSGFDAVRQGQYRANTAAAEIARAGAPVNPAAAGSVPLQAATAQPVASTGVESNRPVGMVSALVALEQARQEVEAGASIIDTADEILGTLLCIHDCPVACRHTIPDALLIMSHESFLCSRRRAVRCVSTCAV